MIKSMTGFGRGEASYEGKYFKVELKSVNHRFTDIFIKLPKNISFLEEIIRKEISQKIKRGKVDVYVLYECFEDKSINAAADMTLAESYYNAMLDIKEKFNIKEDISLSLISRMPDVIKLTENKESEEQLKTVFKRAVVKAVDSLIEMREAEGRELYKNLLGVSENSKKYLNIIRDKSKGFVNEYKEKLSMRIEQLLESTVVDETRLAMEVAIFADKSNIDEEITRLDSHFKQFDKYIKSSSPVGRKLDFLIQEMNREANTISSKTNDLEVTKIVVELKSEIEKLREQVQNIE